MYQKEMLLLLMFLGTLNAISSKRGFYLDENKPANIISIQCITLHNMESLTAKVLKNGVVLNDSLDLLKLGYKQTLKLYAVVEFGLRKDVDIKTQFYMLIMELLKRNLSPMIFINVHSLHNGISKNQTAEQLIKTMKATARYSGLHMGLQSSKRDYENIFGNLALELPLMYDSTRDGPFVPFSSFQSPEVDINEDIPLICADTITEGRIYTTNIEEGKASQKSSIRVSFKKLSNKN